MAKLRTEEAVKKALDIENFRAIPKDKIMNFVELMDDMTPEVRLAAIAQFPNFKGLAKDALTHFETAQVKAAEGQNKSAAAVHEGWADVRRILERELERDVDYSVEQRMQILTLINETGKEQAEIHQLDRSFWSKFQENAAQIVAGVLTVSAVVVAGTIVNRR